MKNLFQSLVLIPLLWFTGIGVALGEKEKPVQVSWKMLNGLNYKTGEMTKEVEGINGKRVKIPGFMVSLEGDAEDRVYEFLFVPNKGACIHVPPPPPNLTIHVKMPEKKPAKMQWGPAVLEGILRVEDNITEINLTGIGSFVESSYEMEGIAVTEYDADSSVQ